MSDPRKKTYPIAFGPEFKTAAAELGSRAGALEWSPHDYEAFTYREPSVSLVFYPHKTSAGNYHLRVRDQGSKDKKLAAELMRQLFVASGSNCSFSQKGVHIT